MRHNPANDEKISRTDPLTLSTTRAGGSQPSRRANNPIAESYMKRTAILTAAGLGLWLLSLALPGQQREAQAQGGDGDKLALKAKVILEKYCEKCHGQTKLKGAFDVRDPKSLQTKDRKGRLYVAQS